MNWEVKFSYQVLSDVYLKGTYASIGLNQTLSKEKGQPVNTKLITKIVYGVIEKDISLEYIIEQFLTKTPPKRIMLLLKMGVYMHFFLNSLPDYTIVNELVNLAKNSPEKYLAGLVNATLKNIFSSPIQLPKPEDDFIKYCSIKYGYPVWLIKELSQQYSPKELVSLLSTKLTTDTHIRIKQGKEKEFHQLIKDHEIRFSASFDESAGYVDYFTLLQHPEWKSYYVVQGCPSMIVAKNMPDSSTILDICAAPGGKSVYLAQLQPQATITACDLYAHRTKLIDDFAKGQQIHNIKTVVQDATKSNLEWKEKFDGVVCDVPCSGTGVIGKKPDILLNRTPDNLVELVNVQLQILDTACEYVKHGGTLIYSTCSILRKENQEIVQQFLDHHPDFHLKKINTYGIPVIEEGLMVTFYPPISKTEGFFIAIMERI